MCRGGCCWGGVGRHTSNTSEKVPQKEQGILKEMEQDGSSFFENVLVHGIHGINYIDPLFTQQISMNHFFKRETFIK